MSTHTRNDGIECPHCHYIERDQFELDEFVGGGNHGELQCERCRKSFTLVIYESRTYETAAPEEPS